jgi:hypothetical protein
MSTYLPRKRKHGVLFYIEVTALWLAVAGMIAFLTWDHIGASIPIFASTTSNSAKSGPNPMPTVIRLGNNRSTIRSAPGNAGSETRRFEIIDGDTIRVDGQTYRLVGFDTPESGDKARCPAENNLAARATARLGEIMSAGNIEFERVPCSCKPGTEGTRSYRCSRFEALRKAAVEFPAEREKYATALA